MHFYNFHCKYSYYGYYKTLLTLRRLMSYIYIYIWSTHSRGFQITHNDAPQSVGLLWTSDQLVAETST